MKKYLFILIAFVAVNSVVLAQTADNSTKPKAEKVKQETKDRPQCEAMTKKGTRCKHKAMDGSQYCKMHAKKMAKEEKK